MKKFLIALCGICVVTTAFCALPDGYYEPHKVDSTITNNWGNNLTITESYNGTLENNAGLYPDLDNQMYPSNDAPHYAMLYKLGTWDDEGAIVIYAARKIYAHGAKFCRVQVQAANSNGDEYTWLDYHWKDDSTCRTLCEYGWSGTSCEKQENICISLSPISALFSTLKDDAQLITNSDGNRYKATLRHTTEMDVFDYDNEKDGSGDTQRQSSHVLLGVIKNVPYGIEYAPIKVIGRRNRTLSWIKSAKYKEDARGILCQYGYKVNENGTACEKGTTCGTSSENNHGWCNGFKNFDSEKHVSEVNTAKKCKYYHCFMSNYGFKSKTDHDCIPCGEKGMGINEDFVCAQCGAGQCVTKNGQCTNNCNIISKSEMVSKNNDKRCWLKTDAKEFWNCVLEN